MGLIVRDEIDFSRNGSILSVFLYLQVFFLSFPSDGKVVALGTIVRAFLIPFRYARYVSTFFRHPRIPRDLDILAITYSGGYIIVFVNSIIPIFRYPRIPVV